jgi:hypothetical protein
LTRRPLHHTCWIRRKWQGGGHQGEQASQNTRGAKQVCLVAKGNHFKHEGHQEGLDPEEEVRSQMDFGEFGDLAKLVCISWSSSHWIMSLPSGLVKIMDPNSPSHVR